MKYNKILFWFRQDLRVQDNLGLYYALQHAKEMLPIFIFDTTLFATFPSPDQRLVFVVAAVEEVERQLQQHGLQLEVYIGDPAELVPQIAQTHKCDAIYANRSYGSGSITRDRGITKETTTQGIQLHMRDDYLLVEPDQVPARKVFTPFFRLRQKVEKRKPIEISEKKILAGRAGTAIDRKKIKHTLSKEGYLPENSTYLMYRPVQGRKERLTKFDRDAYIETRNLPAIDGSTKLSPYTRFGLISIRHIYAKLADRQTPGAETIISELARREFWHHIAHHFPESRRMEFQEKRRNLERGNNEARFEARKTGTTGYPIVDAGMRQLLQEGWMHNRVRMIVASFLTKDLLIDRRRGEQHFAAHLLDYDANVNIGNRQRAASVGADPKPLRIFSPILQAQRFDPAAEYILKYCPELKGQEVKAIHDPLTYKLAYISPIVNHYDMGKAARLMYKGEKRD